MGEKEKANIPVWFWWLVTLAVLSIMYTIFVNFVPYGITIDNQSIAFFIIGALATFVVVGNYVQVVRIENNIKDEMKIIRDDIKQVRNIKKGVSREWKEIIRKTKHDIDNNVFMTIIDKIKESESPDPKDFIALIDRLKTIGKISETSYNKYKDTINSKETQNVIIGLSNAAYLDFLLNGGYYSIQPDIDIETKN